VHHCFLVMLIRSGENNVSCVNKRRELQFLFGVMMIAIDLVSSPVNNGKKQVMYTVCWEVKSANQQSHSCCGKLTSFLCKFIVAQMTQRINPD